MTRQHWEDNAKLGRGGCVVRFGAFGAEGRWFDSTSSRHVGAMSKSFPRNCLYDVMWRPVAALRLNSTPVIDCYHPFILYLLTFCGMSDCILSVHVKKLH